MTMAEEHSRDYAHKQACDDLRRSIEAFQRSPQRRLTIPLSSALEHARTQLQAESEHIVRVWD